MKLLYLDCFAGISGDMFLGALLDLGVTEAALRAGLAGLGLPGVEFSARRVTRQNITAVKFDCAAEHAHGHEHRGYTEIAALIEASSLAETVKRRATSLFHRIGVAEAKIHGRELDQVHFHEIGALDSVVDLVGACLAVEALGVDEVQALPPPLGSGFVETAHGRFPVPAPATLELLKGVPTQSSPEPGELVTPTGAALLAEFCAKFGPMPAMSVAKIGYGAGTRELGKTPNVLRAVLGETSSATGSKITSKITIKNTSQITSASEGGSAEIDTVAVIETNIDDMNPQLFGDVTERLLAAGALDVFLTAVQMKKNRPGTLLTVLCERAEADRFAELVLAHTTSFGVRLHEVQRRKLAREIVSVATKFGPVAVKLGRLGGRIVSRAPEYESCKQAALAAGVPVKLVHQEAARVAEESV